MSEHIDDGGPAFPQIPFADQAGNPTFPAYFGTGMCGASLRDWFAGQVLAATNPVDLSFGTVGQPSNPWPSVAADCYRAADAMIAARKVKP